MVLRDAGEHQEMDDKHTLPQYLHSKPIMGRRAGKRQFSYFEFGEIKTLPANYVSMMRKTEDRRQILLESDTSELHFVRGHGGTRDG
eukprot:7391004-Pyramimonas_sp.AAC.1